MVLWSIVLLAICNAILVFVSTLVPTLTFAAHSKFKPIHPFILAKFHLTRVMKRDEVSYPFIIQESLPR
jgi:hypothetical protein